MSPLLALAACGWISAADRDRRWDLDQDGVPRPADCDDSDPSVGADCSAATDADPPDSPPPPTGETGDTGPPGTTGETGACEPPLAAVAVADPAGEQGITSFSADASASVGAGLAYTFDWGDGTGTAAQSASPLARHTYAEAGGFVVTVTVRDLCGQTDAAETWLAVSAPGALLRVSTATDEDDPETAPGGGGWLGAGLSLREALRLASEMDGAQVVSFLPGLATARIGGAMPALSDPNGVLIGAGVIIDGSAGGAIVAAGRAAVVAGVQMSGFSDPGALVLAGDGAVARGITVRGSALALEVSGEGSLVLDSALLGNGSSGAQVDLRARATLRGVQVADGRGVGVRIRKQGSGSILAGCRISGNQGAGILLEKHTDDIAVHDSSLVANRGDGLRVEDTHCDRLDLRNTILAHNDGHGLAGALESFAPGAPDHDLWFDNAAGDCEGCDGLGASSLTLDPALADPAGGDLRPLPGSPAIDAGSAVTGFDRNGPDEGYWFGDAPDIGAVEVR